MANNNFLFKIADRQQGYFTSRQAEESGYYRSHFQRYIDAGEWLKEMRGIYRLARYPVTERPELVIWSLWSQNRRGENQGTWSHETALDIYEVSDVMPSKMHLTVPNAFRKGIAIPKVLTLHYADLKEDEVRRQQGYRVTTPIRTLIDILTDGKLSTDLIAQAINDALKLGLISRNELNNHVELKRFCHDHQI